jgi:hypothetical protein
MAGVEDDRIVRRVEHPVQCQRQLDQPEVGPKCPPVAANFVDQKITDLMSQIT